MVLDLETIFLRIRYGNGLQTELDDCYRVLTHSTVRVLRYGDGLQTELALPLWLNIVPPADVDRVIATLVHDLELHNWTVTTGIFQMIFTNFTVTFELSR